jgi:hypothetical protein
LSFVPTQFGGVLTLCLLSAVGDLSAHLQE